MSRNYSKSDQEKILSDTLADLRAKGADVLSARIVHPGGFNQGIKELRQNSSFVVDQSQSQTHQNRQDLKNSRKR